MIVSKGEFARRRNVSAARVSQWIGEGKIHGPAIVGEGRGAQLDEEIACRQLEQRLDIDQRHSGNGLKTTLLTQADRPPAGEAPPAYTVADKIAEQRLELLQRQNREKATQEAVTHGLLCETSDARQATGRQIGQVIARVEGSLPEIASELAAQFKLPQRDVLHALRGAWRKIRKDAAIEARERAEPLPERTGFDLGDVPVADGPAAA